MHVEAELVLRRPGTFISLECSNIVLVGCLIIQELGDTRHVSQCCEDSTSCLLSTISHRDNIGIDWYVLANPCIVRC